eukprot:71222-Prorocentrum_lima.AAC.1
MERSRGAPSVPVPVLGCTRMEGTCGGVVGGVPQRRPWPNAWRLQWSLYRYFVPTPPCAVSFR